MVPMQTTRLSWALRRCLRSLGLPLPRTIRWLPTADYASRSGSTWHPVYGPTVVDRPVPINLGTRDCDLSARLVIRFPETAGVVALPGGRLFGPAGWVVSSDGVLLPEHSFFRHYFDKMPLPPDWGSVRRVSGTVLSLASDWSHINYGHYLLDSLTRWHLFTAAGYSADDVQGIYCPAANTPRGGRLAERLGIPCERCLLKPLAQSEGLQADLLLAPTFPAFRCNYPDWIVGFLRAAVHPTATPTRRLYITRGQGRRALQNEDDLLPLLRQRDFEIYDPLRASDPPGDFAMAATVVGAHGAGLADLAFCPRGARVLELIPSDHVHPYFCSLAQAAGLRYGYLVGTSLGERPQGTWGPSPFNFTVDPDELEWALDATLGEPWPPTASPRTGVGHDLRDPSLSRQAIEQHADAAGDPTRETSSSVS